jgi:hypothetical protein
VYIFHEAANEQGQKAYLPGVKISRPKLRRTRRNKEGIKERNNQFSMPNLSINVRSLKRPARAVAVMPAHVGISCIGNSLKLSIICFYCDVRSKATIIAIIKAYC